MDLQILQILNNEGIIADSKEFCAAKQINHDEFVGHLKSLEADSMIKLVVKTKQVVKLSEEALSYVKSGASPEVAVFNNVPEEGILMKDLEAKMEKVGMPKQIVKIAIGTGMRNKWYTQEKLEKKVVEPPTQGKKKEKDVNVKILRKVQQVKDDTLETLKKIHNGESVDKKVLDILKKRSLVSIVMEKSFAVSKGESFALERKKPVTDLTTEMITSGSWKNVTFKDYNFNAVGKKVTGGHLHPLLKVRAEFRTIFLEMGFEEMQTNNFVESSFWNFDALFTPQQHPARDAHDTFFLKDPENCQQLPDELASKVKDFHEKGGDGSIGYRYNWKTEEAKKNIMRTHTTAVSTRYLYALAQEIKKNGYQPKKYFSIDRVFRNEVTDDTHLCEFHQIEGMVVGKNLSLGDLIGTISTFFEKIGITQLKFKPAYNPYTEPSMEIFAYHPQLKKTIEIGNSGMFRPEMLVPLGLPKDVTVIAWGLSLERPTMIKYGISKIKELVGHKVPLQKIEASPICIMDI